MMPAYTTPPIQHRVLLWGALSSLFTLAIVQHSLRSGRLVLPPTLDDVSYFDDALGRIRVWDAKGLSCFLQDLVVRPPHSPFSEILAMVSFMLFGLRDWAPYAGNSVIVFALLLGLDRWMEGTSLAQRCGVALFCLATPYAGLCIAHFRPDLGWGIVTALLLMLVAEEPPQSSSAVRRRTLGFLLALALLAKPSVVPQSLTVFALVYGLRALVGPHGGSGSFLDALRPRTLAPLVLPVLLLAGPYFAVAGAHVVQYIYTNVLGTESRLWVLQADVPAQMEYFLVGESGKLMFGSHLGLLGVLGGVAIVLSFRLNWEWRSATVLGSALLAAYLFPTVNPVKNPFLAAPFQALSVLLAAVLLARAFVTHNRNGRKLSWAGAAAWTSIVASVGLYQWPHFISPAAEWARADKRVADVLSREVIRYIGESAFGQRVRLFMTTAGPVNAYLLSYRARMEGFEVEVADDLHRLEDMERFRSAMSRADVVVASEPGNGFAIEWLPSTKLQDQTLAFARTLPEHRELVSVEALFGKRFFLFARLPAFGGWQEASGLGRLEGPYPQWDLPVVRWGLAPGTRLEVTLPAAASVELRFAGSVFISGQRLVLFANSREVAEVEFEPIQVVTREVTVELPAGRSVIDFRYDRWDASADGIPRAVLFRKLMVLYPREGVESPINIAR